MKRAYKSMRPTIQESVFKGYEQLTEKETQMAQTYRKILSGIHTKENVKYYHNEVPFFSRLAKIKKLDSTLHWKE